MNSITKKLQKILFVTAFMFISSLVVPNPTLAVCPICTVAVGAGLGVSRYLGIDDSITGIWIGGLIISITFWTIDWIKKRKWKMINNLSDAVLFYLTLAVYLTLTYPPLWFSGVIGHPFNTVLGIDKLIFGSIVGAVFFLLGIWTDKKAREIRKKQFFNYQKVVFPVVALTIISLVVYFYGGYLY